MVRDLTSPSFLAPGNSSFPALEGAAETELGGDAFDTMSRVQVLDHGELITSRRALADDDRRVGEKVFPDLSVTVSNKVSHIQG